MNVSNIKFRSSFLTTYNKHNKKSSNLSNIEKNVLNAKQPSMSDTLLIDKLKVQLSKAQKSESDTQESMSFLQEKNKAIDSLKDMSQKLKELSSKYNSNDVTDKDKQDIEKQANELIKNMDDIINSTFGDKSIFGEQQINVETSHGSDIVISLKSFDISLDSDINKGNNKDNATGFHIEGKLSIEDILEDTNRIENNLIKPLDKYSSDIKKQMVGLVNNVMYQNMIVTMSAKKLGELGAIDGFTESEIIKNSNIILKNATSALYCQSSGLEKDIVSQLLQ